MGITISYTIRVKDPEAKPLPLVRAMRSICMDLPFTEVTEVAEAKGRMCDNDHRKTVYGKKDPAPWLASLGFTTVDLPWNKRMSRTVCPERVVGFQVWPGPGCETATIGLCKYPAEVVWQYRPEDDARYERVVRTKHSVSWEGFDWLRWDRICYRKYGQHRSPSEFHEDRTVKTGFSGWDAADFCKTQYANNPALGGLPHFLRCHITLVTALERIGKIPGVRVSINDEGHYGRARYSDDWREAMAEGREPTYVWHKATHDPKVLAAQVTSSGEALAVFFGAMKDALAGTELCVASPITEQPNFEQLEFNGRKQEHLRPFLDALGTQAAAVAAANPQPAEGP